MIKKSTGLRIKIIAGSLNIGDKVPDKSSFRVSGFGKVWSANGVNYQYAYYKYSALDALNANRMAGQLR